MIGLGTWEAPINTIAFRGIGRMIISDNNGEYDFKFEIPDVDIPEIVVSDIVEDGNTLTASAECDLVKGKKIPVSVTFEGDTLTGLIKIPFIGRVKLNGKRIG
jgi:hypothetical protein